MLKSWKKFTHTIDKTLAGETREAKAVINFLNEQKDNAHVIGQMVTQGPEATQEALTQKNHEEAQKINQVNESVSIPAAQTSTDTSTDKPNEAIGEGNINHDINNNNTEAPNIKTPKSIDQYFAEITKENAEEMLEEFINDGYTLDSCNSKGQTLLHLICEKNDTFFAGNIIAQGADVNVQDKFGISPLHIAAKNQNPELVKTLLKNLAHINSLDCAGNAPIHYAFNANNFDCLNVLKEHAADLNITNKKGQAFYQGVASLEEFSSNLDFTDSDDSPYDYSVSTEHTPGGEILPLGEGSKMLPLSEQVD